MYTLERASAAAVLLVFMAGPCCKLRGHGCLQAQDRCRLPASAAAPARLSRTRNMRQGFGTRAARTGRCSVSHFSPAAACAAAAPTQARTMAGTNVRRGVNRWQPGDATFAPDRVLVQFKSSPVAAAAAATQAAQPLPGLQLVRLVGEHHRTPVPPPAAPGVAAAAAASGRRVPPNAHMLFQITDGMSVQAKVAQLRANPGERAGGWEADAGCLQGRQPVAGPHGPHGRTHGTPSPRSRPAGAMLTHC